MDWHLVFSWVAVICLALAAVGVTFKPEPRISFGWLGLTIWAALILLVPAA